MGNLKGLDEYLAERYKKSIFDEWLASQSPVFLHVHDRRLIEGRIVRNDRYELLFENLEGRQETIHKTEIKLAYPAEIAATVQSQIKKDDRVKGMKLQAKYKAKGRHFIKNKSLFVLLKERTLVNITLLEGEILRGLITDFSRYEITLSLKGGLPVTLLRHAVWDVRDKKGVSYLKTVQQKRKDWIKSSLYFKYTAEEDNPKPKDIQGKR